MTDKIYIFQGKEKKFDNGGSKIRLSTPIEELEKLIILQRGKGETWMNIDICERRQPSDKGMTHYGVLDTWKPDAGQTIRQPPVHQPQVTQVNNNNDFDGDIPF